MPHLVVAQLRPEVRLVVLTNTRVFDREIHLQDRDVVPGGSDLLEQLHRPMPVTSHRAPPINATVIASTDPDKTTTATARATRYHDRHPGPSTNATAMSPVTVEAATGGAGGD